MSAAPGPERMSVTGRGPPRAHGLGSRRVRTPRMRRQARATAMPATDASPLVLARRGRAPRSRAFRSPRPDTTPAAKLAPQRTVTRTRPRVGHTRGDAGCAHCDEPSTGALHVLTAPRTFWRKELLLHRVAIMVGGTRATRRSEAVARRPDWASRDLERLPQSTAHLFSTRATTRS